MVHHYARPRRAKGAWLEALLADQARHITGETLEELTTFEDAIRSHTPTEMIAADQPGPARGYARLFTLPDEPGTTYARMHVIPGQPDEVYRALFSQARVHANRLAQDTTTPIIVDTLVLADHVADAIDRLGTPYGVDTLSIAGTPEAPILNLGGPISDTIAEEISAGSLTITTEANDADESDTTEETDTFNGHEATNGSLANSSIETSETAPDGSTEIHADDADTLTSPWDAEPTPEESPDTEVEVEDAEPAEVDLTGNTCPECGDTFSATRYMKQHHKSKHA